MLSGVCGVSAAALPGPAVRAGPSARNPTGRPAPGARRGHGLAGLQPAGRSRGPAVLRAASSGDAEERAFPIGGFEEADIRANISEAGKRLRRTLAEAGAAVAESALVGWPWSAEDAPEDAELSQEEATWAAWERSFAAIDEEEKVLTALRSQLENAIISENYDDAMQVKVAIDAVAEKDAVGNVLKEMDSALREERYADAARLRDEGGVGLLGWWAGRGESKDGHATDPFGHVVKVTGRHGRYVAQAYTARDLADLQELRDAAAVGGPAGVPLPGGGGGAGAGLGIPVMELFLRQDGEGRYVQQACAFRGEPMDLGAAPGAAAGASGQGGGWGVDPQWARGGGGGGARAAPLAAGAGLKPPPAGDPYAAPFPQDHAGAFPADDDEIPDLPYEGVGGGNLLQLERVPAELRALGRSEFVLDVRDGALPPGPAPPPPIDGPELGAPPSAADDGPVPKGLGEGSGLPVRGGGADPDAVEDGVESAEEKWQRVAQEVAKLEKGSVTSKRRLAQALKDAAEHMLEGGLPGAAGGGDPLADALTREVEPLYTTLRQTRTRFTKLDVAAPPADPFTGLYLGVFGPHGPEVLQLRRGRWGGDPLPEGADLDECVEASKVTGDANVPVGVASFRARVGPRHRLDHRGVYPEELCVVGRYVGEGRVAQAGFKDSRWVEGELLQFGASGAALTGGAELGFVWAVPGERRFLLLFKRLDLTKV